MRTFSEIVDSLQRSGVGANADISISVNHVNAAVKELVGIRSEFDLVEQRLPIRINRGKYVHSVPFDFSQMRAVLYDGVTPSFNKKPGLVQHKGMNFWYQSGTNLVFAGLIRSHVDLAYYRITPTYRYYPEDKRSVRTSVNNPDMIYEYRGAPDSAWEGLNLNNQQHITAMLRHTNQFIREHAEFILIGAESYAANSIGQLDRGGRLATTFFDKKREIHAKYNNYVIPEH